jgi:hypothetical protein
MRIQLSSFLLFGTLIVSAVPGAALSAPPVAASSASGGVTRVAIDSRVTIPELTFGETGQYEKLVGRAYLEADPTDPHNSIITDIDKASRNARGMVEYSTDLYILKPVDMSRSNGILLFDVNNRGNKSFENRYNDARGTANANDPTTVDDFGDGFLMREGYTVVAAAWEGDVQPGAGRMTIELPTARDPTAPLTGPVSVTFDVARQIPMAGAMSLPLSGRPEIASHEAASLDTSTATITVRDNTRAPDEVIASDRWAFATCDRDLTTGQVSNLKPSTTDICVFDGFDPNRLYQLTYTAKNPQVSGLGFAAMRDVISFLRYANLDSTGTANPLAGKINTAICSGVSQSGHILRSYLYLGFNEDTAGRKTCDGAMAYISGANRSELNTRFSNPEESSAWGRAGVFPRIMFPFSYAVTTDPITGQTDGILKRPSSDPMVMQIDTENEYWQADASLVAHDGLGNPVPLPDNARYYVVASGQHGSGTAPSRGICEQLTNPLSHAAFSKALLVAMDQWVTHGTTPPPSQYPRVDDGTLVKPDQGSVGFPNIPGVTYLPFPNQLVARDFGPGFSATGGVPAVLPGTQIPGTDYEIFVPRTNEDGLDVAGLRRPDDVQTPIATLAGWNTRGPGFQQSDLCGLNGMMVPFAATEADRRANGDPRPSLEARYPTHADYVGRVTMAAYQLMDDRYLLQEDVDRIVRDASARQVP